MLENLRCPSRFLKRRKYPHTGVAFTLSTDVSEEACWILLGCSSVETVPIIFQVGPHSAPWHRARCGPEPLRSSPGPASPPFSRKGLPSAGLELEEGAEGTTAAAVVLGEAGGWQLPWAAFCLWVPAWVGFQGFYWTLYPFGATPSFASANQKPFQGADCGSPERPSLALHLGIGCSWAKRSPLKHS